jgi:sarcosine oxidase subunit beta
VVAVETDEGPVACDHVVNATGPWARAVGALADVPLPVAPKRRQIAVVEPAVPYPEDAPLTVDLGTGAHFAPEREGDALVAGHFSRDEPDQDPEAYRTDYDLDWVATALESVNTIAGYFGEESRVKNGWAGLYAITPDHSPVIEESRPGFVNAVGFSGHGFMHAPATGQVVADLVRTGGTDIVDLEEFRLDRFDGSSPAGESVVI